MTIPTPRTDAAVACNEPESVFRQYARLECLARQLETELTRAIASRKKYAEELQQVAEAIATPFAPGKSVVETVKEKLAELTEARAELNAYRNGGVTEEILRRNDGHIKVGNGCEIAIRETTADLTRLRAVADELAAALEVAKGGFKGSLLSHTQIDAALARYHAATTAKDAANTGVIHRTE